MAEQLTVQLLPGLFERIDEDQRIRVLHLGPALPETLDFLATYRCKVWFADVFSELPLDADPEDGQSLEDRLARALALPAGERFDLVLFWDLCNYLQPAAIEALMRLLRHHWHRGTRGYALAVHNTRAPQRDDTFAIARADTLVLRSRPSCLPGYAPLAQSRLKQLLLGFEVRRSVLLGDGRVELFLAAKI